MFPARGRGRVREVTGSSRGEKEGKGRALGQWVYLLTGIHQMGFLGYVDSFYFHDRLLSDSDWESPYMGDFAWYKLPLC